MKNVVIIGGGASGLMAALTAAEDKNNKVIILERQARIGRKLLATGNGRCNLTNVDASPANYHGEVPEFAVPALEKFPPEKVLEFFGSLGLVTVTEYGGRVYPLSNSANSVLDVLRFALEKDNIELKTGCSAKEIRRDGQGFKVLTDSETIAADYLIVACGGAAGAKLGGVMDGYELLQALGHKRTKLYPALVQITSNSPYPRSLKGVRAMCSVKLCSGKTLLASSYGELQFTESGVSGPAAFDISRCASTEGSGCTLHLDFLRDYSENDIFAMLSRRRAGFPLIFTDDLLTGILHNRLGRMVVKYAGLASGTELNLLDDAQLHAVAAACKNFCIDVAGTEGFDNAQVTAGGIKTTGINPETMESWFVPNLFICGELLDIDADCGGYNLQWAWASGHLAGRLGK